MNQPHNLTEALYFALKQNWWVPIAVIVIPLTFAYLFKKFEVWLEKKFNKNKKYKKRRSKR